MGGTRILLFPFALLYDLVTRTRNFLYDRNILKSVKFEANVIVVGNLAVGGTGKTPMIETLIRLLQDQYRVATLSRGYKRKTRGFRIVSGKDTAQTVGDEPLQIFRKFGKEVFVTVGEERETAIPFILAEQPDTDVILLDDAFQYRIVRPSLNILLTRYTSLFTDDYLMPMGSLRECRGRASRSDMVVVTDSPPQLSDKEKTAARQKISKYTPAPVFFSYLDYGKPYPLLKSDEKVREEIILVTGVAKPKPVKEHISKHYKLKEHLVYSDHFAFKDRDLEKIREKYYRASPEKTSIIITEKDATKWLDICNTERFSDMSIFVLPVKHNFLENFGAFKGLIINSVIEYSQP